MFTRQLASGIGVAIQSTNQSAIEMQAVSVFVSL